MHGIHFENVQLNDDAEISLSYGPKTFTTRQAGETTIQLILPNKRIDVLCHCENKDTSQKGECRIAAKIGQTDKHKNAKRYPTTVPLEIE